MSNPMIDFADHTHIDPIRDRVIRVYFQADGSVIEITEDRRTTREIRRVHLPADHERAWAWRAQMERAA